MKKLLFLIVSVVTLNQTNCIKAKHKLIDKPNIVLSGDPAPTNKDLFKKIRANNPEIKSDIDFWLRQVQEHALFIYLGIVNPDFKRQAKVLYKKLKHVTPQNTKRLLPLLRHLRDLQLNILNKQKAGQWVGWLFPSILRHMTLELDYFVDKLNGIQYTPEDEKAFWKKEADGRIGAVAHLLDPEEKALVKEANSIIDKYFNVAPKDKNQFIKNALDAVKAVNAFATKLDKKNIESIISKTLAEHEDREGKRGEEILSKLPN